MEGDGRGVVLLVYHTVPAAASANGRTVLAAARAFGAASAACPCSTSMPVHTSVE